MACKHKRTSYTGEQLTRLSSRGEAVWFKLIYRCCDCGKEVKHRKIFHEGVLR